MKIVKKTAIGRRPVYDLTVDQVNSYITEDGTIHHNTGNMYAADNIFFLGRRQDATGTGANKTLNGYDFVVKIEKSRFIREGSQFIVNVSFEKGLAKYTGMFELMQDLGLMETVGKKYELTDPSSGEVLEGHARKWYDEHPEFWEQVVANDAIDEMVRKKYRLGENKLVNEESV